MIIIITKYGRTPLGLSYSDEQLRSVVAGFICIAPSTFRYMELYNYVMDRALHEDMFQKEPYTRYTNIVLTDYDEHRLSMILWEMIWDEKIVIEFRNNINHQSHDTVFGVVNHHEEKGGRR